MTLGDLMTAVFVGVMTNSMSANITTAWDRLGPTVPHDRKVSVYATADQWVQDLPNRSGDHTRPIDRRADSPQSTHGICEMKSAL